MIIKCYNENHPYILFLDLEFFYEKGKNHLIQFAGLLFQRVEDNIYQLKTSVNQYITDKVCYPFVEYTSITNNFLKENGIPLNDFIHILFEDILGEIPDKELLVVSHGLKNDRLVLLENDIDLTTNIDGYCTFTNARRILSRSSQLTLQDIANESGYYLHNAHNAYNDVWATVAAYTYLKKIEQQRKDEKLCTSATSTNSN